MNIQFQLPTTYINDVKQCLNIAQDLYHLSWYSAFQKLYQEQYTLKNVDGLSKDSEERVSRFLSLLLKENVPSELHNQFEEFFASLKEKWDALCTPDNQESNRSFTLPLSWDEICELEKAIDVCIRLVCGQWDILGQVLSQQQNEQGKHIYTYFFCTEPFVEAYRNDIVPYYQKLSRGASFGIHNPEMQSRIRHLYDIYKTLRFESGDGGVYGYPVSPISEEGLPVFIRFPYESTHVYTSKEALIDWVETSIHSETHSRSLRQYQEELWLPTSECRVMLAKEGQKYGRKYNGYYELISEDSK